ncbi:hypothetical protein BaRGS_00012162 [Batillaria attramentaria]|uniref:Uncharacterized protein n=1 Tax=Batillaria attramentaria TaxID=370345 RepID=A0ABD0LB87_9CAEN
MSSFSLYNCDSQSPSTSVSIPFLRMYYKIHLLQIHNKQSTAIHSVFTHFRNLFQWQTHEDKQRKYAQREEAFKHQRHLESNGPSNGGTELSGNVNVAYENEERNTKL